MLGLSPGHLLIIMVILLIVVGPGKLPEVGAAIGKSVREFQKATGGLTSSLTGGVTSGLTGGVPGSLTETLNNMLSQPAQTTPPASPAQPVQPSAPAQSYYSAQQVAVQPAVPVQVVAVPAQHAVVAPGETLPTTPAPVTEATPDRPAPSTHAQ